MLKEDFKPKISTLNQEWWIKAWRQLSSYNGTLRKYSSLMGSEFIKVRREKNEMG